MGAGEGYDPEPQVGHSPTQRADLWPLFGPPMAPPIQRGLNLLDWLFYGIAYCLLLAIPSPGPNMIEAIWFPVAAGLQFLAVTP